MFSRARGQSDVAGERVAPLETCAFRRGPYRGDISALALLSSSRRHLLLAGSGPQIFVFDLITGALLCFYKAFDGIRVHGLLCHPDRGIPSTSGVLSRRFLIAVHGEKRVKLLKMHWHLEDEAPQFRLVGCLPRFSHWVMDVRFLQDKETSFNVSSASGSEDVHLLAVGLSSNTISIWDLLRGVPIYSVDCSERCLLYSMRMWGDSLGSLRVAAGTIFNEVLIWKPGSSRSRVAHGSTVSKEARNLGSSSESQKGERNAKDTEAKRCQQFMGVKDVVDPVQKLVGHEGSIHRLMWSSDGLKIVSVSDDRSARVWYVKPKAAGGDLTWGDMEAGPVLYGHGSRLWDCHVSDELLITASEDCTCRVWTTEGKLSATLKGHVGRGVWRCVYHADLNILVTGGADSAIKVHSLDKRFLRPPALQSGQGVIDAPLQRPVLPSGSHSFSLTPVWSNAISERKRSNIDSKSEYVRCLRLNNSWSLYVCTNQGAVYHVNLASTSEVSWKLLMDEFEGPVVCMDVLVQEVAGGNMGLAHNFSSNDIIAVGNGRGQVCVMQVRRTAQDCNVEWHHSWAAEKERQLLGIYVCQSLGGRWVITTNPRGKWCLWLVPGERIHHGQQADDSFSSSRCVDVASDSHRSNGEGCKDDDLNLMAYGTGSDARILCIDVCLSLQILVCGDKRGHLTVFSFPRSLLQRKEDNEQVEPCLVRKGPLQLPVLAVFKGAHGISAVTSVSIVSTKDHRQPEILSTGSDGCICTFCLDRDLTADVPPKSQHVRCLGVEKVPALSVVKSLSYFGRAITNKSTRRRLAAGFSGSAFLLWDLTQQCEVVQVTCGGWRRPHSIYVGNVPELEYCFVFIKDQVIQVQRQLTDWELCNSSSSDQILCGDGSSDALPRTMKQALRKEFHGKEISSVLFLDNGRNSTTNEGSDEHTWIATGSEDGTVIISRYTEEMNEQLDPILSLGDHVGGSAIRALALVAGVSLVNNVEQLILDTTEQKEIFGSITGATGNQALLFSAGAKEVLTCWLLDWLSDTDGEERSHDVSRREADGLSSQDQETAFSHDAVPTARWLSTYVPHKLRSRPARRATPGPAGEKKSSSSAEIHMPETPISNTDIAGDQYKDKSTCETRTEAEIDGDQRYLAITAFATKCAQTGTLISFVAAASSNAKVHLFAWHFTGHFWIELAALVYPASLILSIQHLVAPSSGVGTSDAHMILTGSAHGSVALWEVTDLVLECAHRGGHDFAEASGAPSRPMTGRGSQGGRYWKTHKGQVSKSNQREEIGSEMGEDPLKLLSLSRSQSDTLNEIVASPEEEKGSTSFYKNGSLNLCPEEKSQVPSRATLPLMLGPLEELTAVHQSGVNCMSVATVSGFPNGVLSDQKYVVITGGDDQALHVAVLLRILEKTDLEHMSASDDVVKEGANAPRADGDGTVMRMQLLSQSSVPCAHNSAIKGIWTDGRWVFSTGLDQRLRCWRIEGEAGGLSALHAERSEASQSKRPMSSMSLVECMTCVIDVPEAVSLHVKDCRRGQYRIAVAGRGLQVINFDSNSMCRHPHLGR